MSQLFRGSATQVQANHLSHPTAHESTVDLKLLYKIFPGLTKHQKSSNVTSHLVAEQEDVPPAADTKDEASSKPAVGCGKCHRQGSKLNTSEVPRVACYVPDLDLYDNTKGRHSDLTWFCWASNLENWENFDVLKLFPQRCIVSAFSMVRSYLSPIFSTLLFNLQLHQGLHLSAQDSASVGHSLWRSTNRRPDHCITQIHPVHRAAFWG